MKHWVVIVVLGLLVVVRVSIRATRRGRRARSNGAERAPGREVGADRTARQANPLEQMLGDVGIVATREIKERVRGRIFRVGTLLILVIVAAAILVPRIQRHSGQSTERAGVVGALSAVERQAVREAAAASGDSISFRAEVSSASAERDLRAGTIDLALVAGAEVLIDQPLGSKSSSIDGTFVSGAAAYLGTLAAFERAGLSTAQVEEVSAARPIPVRALEGGSSSAPQGSSIIGLVLVFMMLTQYNTWILIGVMQEKSSRVAEVLLATLRPIELLGGKVLGIGLVALAQATLIVGFALGLGAAVGSDVLQGAAPLVLLSELLWLVLGYAFYCWVYAAGGSTAERQDQVQTLALPLSIPVLVAYIFSITVASTGHPDALFKVLAYLPPTAPLCMPVLVSLGEVSWWEFLFAVVVSIASTAAMARFAARIYARAVLQTGARVKLASLVGPRRTRRARPGR